MKYGDYDNVTKDSKMLFDIQARQGSGILLEVVAEIIGKVCNKHKLTELESLHVINTTLADLKEEILERI